MVEIRDEGAGIPSAELPFIGQRFYRADKARSRTQGGAGLGLAIAQALLQAHGSELLLESQESQGTSASFTLPAAP
jgi:signal transduction histidine kinase